MVPTSEEKKNATSMACFTKSHSQKLRKHPQREALELQIHWDEGRFKGLAERVEVIGCDFSVIG